MNRQADLQLDIRETAHGASIWPMRPLVFCAAVFVLFVVAIVPLLLFAESRLSAEQRQHAFEDLGVYP